MLWLEYILFKEVEKRGLQVAVAGIPKTIDNDIAVSYSKPTFNFSVRVKLGITAGFLFSYFF